MTEFPVGPRKFLFINCGRVNVCAVVTAHLLCQKDFALRLRECWLVRMSTHAQVTAGTVQITRGERA